MKKNNKIASTILSLVVGLVIFLIIDWVFYMNIITGNGKTVAFLLGIIMLLVSVLTVLMNETDKRAIESIDYKNNFFGRIGHKISKFLKATSKNMILSSLVIIVLSFFI